jgi:hypothetical protein
MTIGSPKSLYLGEALAQVADALNVLYSLDERVDIRFGAVVTDFGYVVCDDDGRWSVKMKVGEPPQWWADKSRHTPDDE